MTKDNIAYAAQKPAAECEADLNGAHAAVYRDGQDRTLAVTKDGKTEQHSLGNNPIYFFNRATDKNVSFPFFSQDLYKCNGIETIKFNGENVALRYVFVGNNTGAKRTESEGLVKDYFEGTTILNIHLGNGLFYASPSTPVDLDGDGDMELFNSKGGGNWAILDWNGRNPSEVSDSFYMVHRRQDLEDNLFKEALSARSNRHAGKFPLLNTLIVSMPDKNESELIGELTRYRLGEIPTYRRTENPDGTITSSGPIEIDLNRLVEDAEKKQ